MPTLQQHIPSQVLVFFTITYVCVLCSTCALRGQVREDNMLSSSILGTSMSPCNYTGLKMVSMAITVKTHHVNCNIQERTRVEDVLLLLPPVVAGMINSFI